MKKETYLLQEGNFRDESEIKKIDGIDSILEFRYMGAAEFEFGSLPSSLKRIAKDLDAYKVYTTRYISRKGEKLVIFCKEEDIEAVKAMLKKLRRGSQYLKIGVSFVRNFKEEGMFLGDFWWDIDNDFFFFFGEQRIAKVETAMRNLRTRWHDELFPKPPKTSFFKKLFGR